jgi:hypothetical protein
MEHAQEDNDNSIVDFLAKHYGNGFHHHHHNNHHDHENLPFQTATLHSVQMVSFPPLLFDFSKGVVENELKLPILQQQNYSDTYLNSIWQPPQVSWFLLF